MYLAVPQKHGGGYKGLKEQPLLLAVYGSPFHDAKQPSQNRKMHLVISWITGYHKQAKGINKDDPVQDMEG